MEQLFLNTIQQTNKMKSLVISLCFCLFILVIQTEEIITIPTPSGSRPQYQLLELAKIRRTFDGTMNNHRNPQWGSAGSPLRRLCKPNYADGFGKIWEQKPNPRLVINTVGVVENQNIKPDRMGLNTLFSIFGQFVDHDISLSLSNSSDPLPIEVPMCDKFFDKDCLGNATISFNRAQTVKGRRYRTHINNITAWLDGSQIYGSSQQTSKKLRSFKDGKLKISQNNLLPTNQNGFFQAGDFRSNQNIGLTILHTTFFRQHNRMCQQVIKINPKLTDQQIFTIARNWVIGLLQHITYDEFLPIFLGKRNFHNIVGQFKYELHNSPDIIAEFSGAGFRLHSLVWFPFTRNDDYGKVLKTLGESEILSNPNLLKDKDALKQYLNGLLMTPMKQRSIEVTDELRNGLILGPNRERKLDLFSINIQRGRDLGLCPLPKLREVLRLPKTEQFTRIFDNKYKAGILKGMYQNLEAMDLYLVILGERVLKGAVLGETGILLNGIQFRKIRNGDRFWYEFAYPRSVVKRIKDTTLAQVLRRNIGIKNFGENAFLTVKY